MENLDLMSKVGEEDRDRLELERALFTVDSPFLVIPHLNVFLKSCLHLGKKQCFSQIILLVFL